MNDEFDIISRNLLKELKYANVKNKGFVIAFSGIPASGKTHLSKLLENRYKALRISSNDIMKIISEEKLAKDLEENERLKRDYIYYLLESQIFNNRRIILDKSIDRDYKKLHEICKQNNLPLFIIRLKLSKQSAINRIKLRNPKEFENWKNRMNGWYADWISAGRNIKPNITLNGLKPDLELLYSKLDSVLKAE